MKRILFSILALSFLSGCATTHPGKVLASNTQDIVVSVKENSDLSDNYYMFLEYTLENKSGEWMEIQAKHIQLGEGAPSEILSGEKLSAWIEGAELKLRQNNYNTQLLLGSIVAVAGLTAASSKDPGTQKAALGVMAGAVGTDATLALQRSRNAVNSGYKGPNGSVNVPSTHVLAPAKIAPESFIRRWVVIKAPRITDPLAIANFKKEGFIHSKFWPTLETRLDIGGKKIEKFSTRIRARKSSIVQ